MSLVIEGLVHRGALLGCVGTSGRWVLSGRSLGHWRHILGREFSWNSLVVLVRIILKVCTWLCLAASPLSCESARPSLTVTGCCHLPSPEASPGGLSSIGLWTSTIGTQLKLFLKVACVRCFPVTVMNVSPMWWLPLSAPGDPPCPFSWPHSIHWFFGIKWYDSVGYTTQYGQHLNFSFLSTSPPFS